MGMAGQSRDSHLSLKIIPRPRPASQAIHVVTREARVPQKTPWLFTGIPARIASTVAAYHRLTLDSDNSQV
jgi:hypothetical protein